MWRGTSREWSHAGGFQKGVEQWLSIQQAALWRQHQGTAESGSCQVAVSTIDRHQLPICQFFQSLQLFLS